MPILREQRQVSSIGPVGVVRSRGGDAERYNRLANATQKLTELAIDEMGREDETDGKILGLPRYVVLIGAVAVAGLVLLPRLMR